MPTWHSLLNEIKERGSTFDVVRRERLNTLAERTGRNVIIYYSGWLQKPKVPGTQVSDADKIGFMTVAHGLDRSKGLDLFLHTPGGETAATESLVDYLRSMFGHKHSGDRSRAGDVGWNDDRLRLQGDRYGETL